MKINLPHKWELIRDDSYRKVYICARCFDTKEIYIDEDGGFSLPAFTLCMNNNEHFEEEENDKTNI